MLNFEDFNFIVMGRQLLISVSQRSEKLNALLPCCIEMVQHYSGDS